MSACAAAAQQAAAAPFSPPAWRPHILVRSAAQPPLPRPPACPGRSSSRIRACSRSASTGATGSSTRLVRGQRGRGAAAAGRACLLAHPAASLHTLWPCTPCGLLAHPVAPSQGLHGSLQPPVVSVCLRSPPTPLLITCRRWVCLRDRHWRRPRIQHQRALRQGLRRC
jgi:hypothetical protein